MPIPFRCKTGDHRSAANRRDDCFDRFLHINRRDGHVHFNIPAVATANKWTWVEVDISAIAPGELKIFEWRGKPVWVIRRTPDMLESLKKAATNLTDPASKASQQPEYAANEHRSRRPELMVMEGVCTHLGCSPQLKAADAKAEMGGDWVGGFYCPCHGSKFDFAGRVYRGAPAPTNLPVPPYTFLSDSTLVIGEDQKGA